MTFDLLLSKNWMNRVRAIEDHGAKTLTIHSKAGTAATITAAQAESPIQELIAEDDGSLDGDELADGDSAWEVEQDLLQLQEDLDEYEFQESEKEERR